MVPQIKNFLLWKDSKKKNRYYQEMQRIIQRIVSHQQQEAAKPAINEYLFYLIPSSSDLKASVILALSSSLLLRSSMSSRWRWITPFWRSIRL